MRYNSCLFDLDGTLTDPKIGITKSFQYALETFGIQEETNDLVKFIGPPLRESFKNFYQFSQSDTEQAVLKYREYFAEAGIFENTVYPGVAEMLQTLKSGGVILAVATSKATKYAQQILEHFHLDRYFSFISGDKMDGSLTKNGKREIIRIAMSAIGQKDQKVAVMIGDREHDVFGAKEVGIDSIGVTYGYGSREELEKAGAKMIVNSIKGITESIIKYK